MINYSYCLWPFFTPKAFWIFCTSITDPVSLKQYKPGIWVLQWCSLIYILPFSLTSQCFNCQIRIKNVKYNTSSRPWNSLLRIPDIAVCMEEAKEKHFTPYVSVWWPVISRLGLLQSNKIFQLLILVGLVDSDGESQAGSDDIDRLVWWSNIGLQRCSTPLLSLCGSNLDLWLSGCCLCRSSTRCPFG